MPKILMPVIFGGPMPVAGESHDHLPNFGEVLGKVALEIFDLLKRDPGQKRWRVEWEPRLAQVALDRVVDMAKNDWHHHVDPQGHGPNHWVRQSGWKLPDWYAKEPGDQNNKDGNNVESLQYGGGADRLAKDIWAFWMSSPLHKAHLLGEYLTFRNQIKVGVASFYLKDSIADSYHCVLSAPPEGWGGQDGKF